jgi:hypothetical protein
MSVSEPFTPIKKSELFKIPLDKPDNNCIIKKTTHTLRKKK